MIKKKPALIKRKKKKRKRMQEWQRSIESNKIGNSSSLNHFLFIFSRSFYIYTYIYIYLSLCIFSLLHWCKDHSILSPTASHLRSALIDLYLCTRFIAICVRDRTGQARQGSLTDEHSIDVFQSSNRKGSCDIPDYLYIIRQNSYARYS